jgi:ribonuclease T1
MNQTKLLVRRLAINLAALAVLLVPWTARGADLHAFAREAGLRDAAGFAEAVASLDRSGRLPDRYLTKDQAARLGWSPGVDLWKVAPGKSIGGDRFGNREGRLPSAPGRRFFEADLDFAGGKRGAKRLVWSSDGQRWVTIDHYQSFREVPR